MQREGKRMKQRSRNEKWVCIFLFFVSVLGPQCVLAQEYPTKPITLLVPFGPGGDSDLSGRVLSSVAPEHLGQPLLIQLKPGGQGIIGTDQAAKAPPDGYLLLAAGSGWNSALPAIEGRSKGPDEMDAVCRINYNSTLLAVRPESPFKTF